MKSITRLLIVLSLAAAISLPVAVHFTSSAHTAQQIADGPGPIPPWPPC